MSVRSAVTMSLQTGSRLKRVLSGGAITAVVFVAFGFVLFGKQTANSTISITSTPPTAASKATTTPAPNPAIGNFPEEKRFAQWALDHLQAFQMVRSGTPEVLLSRVLNTSQLECLGWYEQRAGPEVIWSLVVVKGDLVQSDMPATQAGPAHARYLFYLQDVNGKVSFSEGSPDWGRLRLMFGNPNFPEDNPLHVSPNGIPSLGGSELGNPAATEMLDKHAGQEQHVSRTIDGWTVTIIRSYLSHNRLTVGYTISGPRQEYTLLDSPALSVGNTPPPVIYYPTETLAGPTAGFAGMDITPVGQSLDKLQDVTFHFELPAIHVKSPPLPQCPAFVSRGPTPTAPLPVTKYPTPVSSTGPDLAVVGPFLLDLKVRIDPIPTPLPTIPPIPTKPMPILPVQTGEPPIEVTSTP